MTLNERRAASTLRTGKDYGQVEGLGDLQLAVYLLPTEDFEGSLYLCAPHAKAEVNFGLADAIDDCDIICDECRNAFYTAQREGK